MNNRFGIKLCIIAIIFIISSLKILSNDALSNDMNIGDAINAIKENNYQEAINIYSNLINKVDTIASFYYGRGLAYYYVNKTDNAIEDFNIAISLNKNDFDSYLGLGIALMEKQQYKTALNILGKGINIDTNITNDNSALIYCRGLVYYQNNDFDNAINDFNKVLSASNNDNAIYGRAISYYKIKDYNSAKIDLENCIKNSNLENNYLNECRRLLQIMNEPK